MLVLSPPPWPRWLALPLEWGWGAGCPGEDTEAGSLRAGRELSWAGAAFPFPVPGDGSVRIFKKCGK